MGFTAVLPYPIHTSSDHFMFSEKYADSVIYTQGKPFYKIMKNVVGKNIYAQGRYQEFYGVVARKSIYTPVSNHLGSRWWTRLARKHLFNAFDLITAQTAYGRENIIKQGVDPDKVIIMPTPVNYEFFKPRGKVTRKEQAVAIGTRPLKRVPEIIKACEEADVRLYVVGYKSKEELPEGQFDWFLPSIETTSSEKVVWTGFLKPLELRKLLWESKFYICNSLYETFCTSAYEAASSGCTLLLPSHPVFNNFKKSALFHSTVGELTDNLSFLLDNPGVARKLSARSSKIAEKFSYKKTEPKWRKLYETFFSS